MSRYSKLGKWRGNKCFDDMRTLRNIFFSKVMGKFRLARHRKHERRLQSQLRDARSLLVRIPRQNIVVTASPGLSVAGLPESLDVDLLVC